MATEIKQIIEKLDHLQSDMDYLKEHLVDVDKVLTDDDIEALKEAEQDFKHKRTKRL